MRVILYVLAVLVFIAGTIDFSLFLSKNPNSLAIGLVGLTVWWAVGSAIAVKTVLGKGRTIPGSSAGAELAVPAYAGFWRRFVAVVIDSVLLMIGGGICGGIAGFILGFVIAASGGDTKLIQVAAGASGVIIGLFLNWLYFTLLESSSKQATLGKMAIGILVTDLQGNQISFTRANGRYWGKVVSTVPLGIGYIMAGVTQKKQALHDKVAGTLVVRR
jgi:uncharacterized RDD family membrane protein YckC